MIATRGTHRPDGRAGFFDEGRVAEGHGAVHRGLLATLQEIGIDILCHLELLLEAGERDLPARDMDELPFPLSEARLQVPQASGQRGHVDLGLRLSWAVSASCAERSPPPLPTMPPISFCNWPRTSRMLSSSTLLGAGKAPV